MIAIKPYRQKPGYCGPSCLKMVLEFFGKSLSEDEIARRCGATQEHGVEAAGLMDAARTWGFSATKKDHATFADISVFLERGVPVIVDWFAQDDGHYCVVVGLDSANIYLQDPELGELRTIDRETFFRVWFDFPGNFIRENRDLILRRMLVIEPKNHT